MINYQLKSKDTSKHQPVYAYITGVFNIPNARLKISIGKSINPNDFGLKSENYSFNSQHIKNSKKPEVLVFKRVLEDFERAVDKTLMYFLGVEIGVDLELFKQKLLENLGREQKVVEKKSDEILVTDFIEDYIEESKELVRKGQKKLAESSMRKYIQVNTHIKNYQEFLKKEIYIHELSYDVFISMIEVINKIAIGKIKLKNNHQKSKSRITNGAGYSLNTLNTFTSRLKYMLGEARIRGYHLHPTLHLDDKRLIIGACKGSKDFYFDEDLLYKIYNHQALSKSTQHAKDYIMLASTTGMRHQSIALLHGQQPQTVTTPTGEEFFGVKNIANKTGIKLLSPLMKPALEVYKRLGEFPKYDSVTTITRQIRALLLEMKVNDKVTLERTIFGVGKVNEVKKMTQVASSHVCRASFITNLLNLRIDRNKVQMMTHKAMSDNSAFSLYDKRSEVDRAIDFFEATKNSESIFFKYK
ncbi:hypothetical protein IF125_12870 [Empedobacter stercoris]|uniref:hypothetical protein n=1 Tax=Empedobacter stercoris TaxID=1628248 RepID=UPI001CE18FEE|nr:hypothetical protein [Empedobacter stercoris]MCA4783135.1 hypothetical protein [Empedobacter stercoris]